MAIVQRIVIEADAVASVSRVFRKERHILAVNSWKRIRAIARIGLLQSANIDHPHVDIADSVWSLISILKTTPQIIEARSRCVAHGGILILIFFKSQQRTAMILAKTAMNPDRGPGAVSWCRATWRTTEKK